jgi:hypothetical protein
VKSENNVPSLEECEIATSAQQAGYVIYTPHNCQTPSAEDFTIGTIWACYKCHDHWEVQDIGDHHHWVRVRRVKYETTSR